jgi:hypothetical protein
VILLGFVFNQLKNERKKSEGDDDDERLLFDDDLDPVLDLPPGIVLPPEGPTINIHKEEYA